jgi:hypothetical protein
MGSHLGAVRLSGVGMGLVGVMMGIVGGLIVLAL